MTARLRFFARPLVFAVLAGWGGAASQETPGEGQAGPPGAAVADQERRGSAAGRPDPFAPGMLPPADVPHRASAQVVVPGDPLLQDRLRIVHWPGDEGRAARALAVIGHDAFLPGLPPELPSRAVIFLAPDRERFDALTGGRVPHWGAGVAIPALSRIVIPLFANPWTGGGVEDRTLLHEWAHLGLHEHLEGLRIPRWFDEGYAQWSSGGWDAASAWRLRVALARGSAPPLDSLTLTWPRDRAGAQLAYLLSATAVQYLHEGSGPRGIELFLERWAESGEFEASFRTTFGMTTAGFERNWVRHVKRRYGWVLVLGQSVVFWILLGVVLLVLFRIRRRRDRERMARLRATEPADAPAWWEPPPHPPIGGYPGEREPRDPGP